MAGPTVDEFRAHFYPDFEPEDRPNEANPDWYNRSGAGTSYGVPERIVLRHMATARLEFAHDDETGGPLRECLLHLIAHRICCDGADSASVDHGAGILTSSGTGNSAVTIVNDGGPVDLQRTKYGREFARLRAALVACA